MNRRDFLKLTGQGTAVLSFAKMGCIATWPDGQDDIARIYGVGEHFRAFDSEGNAYELRALENKLVRLDAAGNALWELGELGTEPGQFNYPVTLEVDINDNIYVVDLGNDRIQVFDTDGRFLRQIGSRTGDSDASLDFPRQVTVHRTGRIYVCDTHDHHIHVYDSEGNLVDLIAEFGTEGDDLNYPVSLDLSPDGTIHVVDAGNNRVQVYSATGKFVRSYGEYGDQVGDLRSPRSVLIDARGTSYVADGAAGHIEVFDPWSRPVTRIPVTFADGRAAAPMALSWAPDNTIYVAARPLA